MHAENNLNPFETDLVDMENKAARLRSQLAGQPGSDDDEITALMERIASVSGAPASKYRVQQEPEVVSPVAFGDEMVRDRLLEVINTLSSNYATTT